MSQLHDAVAAGDLAGVQRLIASQVDKDATDAEGLTPLHRAIELEHDDIALELLHSGADPNIRFFTAPGHPGDDVGLNCLHLAALKGRLSIVDALLGIEGVDINSMGSYLPAGYDLFRATALVLALDGGDGTEIPPRFCHPDVALALLDAGADPNLEFNGRDSVLHICAFRRDDLGTAEQRLAVMEAALDRGANVNVFGDMDYFRVMPLHVAAISGFYEAAERLIQAGAQINFNEAGDFTVPPLSLAPYGDDIEIFRLLLQHGADINGLDKDNFNVLHFCVGHGIQFELTPASVPVRQEMLRLALDLGANVAHAGGESYFAGEDFDEAFLGFEETEKMQPLHMAAEHGAFWAIAPLIHAGADVNARNVQDCTPVMVACMSCDPKRLPLTIRALLAAGADVHTKIDSEWDSDARTALEVLHDRYHYRKDSCTPRHLDKLGLAIAALVAAGDRNTDAIPFDCPGLETALVTVWRESEDDTSAAEALPGIFQRLQAPVQARVRAALLTLHRVCPTLEKELLWDIMDAALALD